MRAFRLSLWAFCLILLLPLAGMADPCGCSTETDCSQACAPCFCCGHAPSAFSPRVALEPQAGGAALEAPPAARPAPRDPRDVFHVPKLP